MMVVEVTGKTLNEAIDSALSKLGTTIDELEYEILEEGTKGFLGIGAKPYRIKAGKKFNPSERARSLLMEVFAAMNMSVSFDIKQQENHLFIELKGENMGVIIGKRGQTLDSLQYLVNLIVNRGDGDYVNIILDAENYRSKRKQTLEMLAYNLARKAKTLKKDITLEPMNPYERRIIHFALQNDRYVTTHSEGDGSSRYVVISPKIVRKV